MSDDPDGPLPALFATIHTRSSERPEGYTPEGFSGSTWPPTSTFLNSTIS